LGQLGVSGGVGHDGHGPGGAEQATAGQPVQPVGQIHCVGRSDDDEHRKRDERRPKREARPEGRQPQLEPIAQRSVVLIDQHRRRRGHGELPQQFHPARDPVRLASEFGQIVDRADCGQSDRHEQARLQVRVAEIAEHEHAGDQPGHDEQPSHRRRGLLVSVQPSDPGRVAFDRFAEPRAEPCD
jgi:hypothetical protein